MTTLERPTPPTLVIAIALESRPTVRLQAMSETDQRRVLDWVNASDELCEIVRLALALERAA